jgi:endonuclease/exonuclease/phosphatase (EEP) superfamily protein YafD
MRLFRLALDVLLWPWLAVVAQISALLAIGAQWGRVSWRWDVAAQITPLFLVAAAVCLVGSFLYRGWMRWGVAAFSVVALVFALSLVIPEFVRSTGPHAPADAPGQLKIVQFNVWHDNPDPEAILTWLDAERPDIAVIEENSFGLQEALARHPAWSVACARCEVLMLSRNPAVAFDTPRPTGYPHIVPLTRAVFRDARGPFTVIGVHDVWPTIPDQSFQERRLAEMIAASPRERLIVTGDFNSTPWSFARRRWDRAFGLVRRERAIPSWPAQTYKHVKWLGLPFLPIDHVYAGPAWATVRVERGPRLTSDHYPVVVTLAPVSPK